MAQKKPTRKQMLDWVNMVSFAVTEANLYLDTHPGDPAALSYFQEYSRLRNQALNDFSALFGPHSRYGKSKSADVGVGQRTMALGRRRVLNVEL